MRQNGQIQPVATGDVDYTFRLNRDSGAIFCYLTEIAVIERIGEVLIQQWEYDIAVMSEPWMYWCLLIPISLYVAFFFVKWAVLTAPAWLPFALIVQAFRK